MQLVISDAHEGLKAAVAKVLAGTSWQRCRVHFNRNILGRVGKAHGEMVTATIRTIFAQPDADAARTQLRAVADMLNEQFPHITAALLDAEADLLAFAAFPKAHWRKIWSTNPLERVNKELKRRSNVVGIFPDDAAVVRLLGAVLLEQHDEWQAAERRYLSEESMKQLTATQPQGVTPALPRGVTCRQLAQRHTLTSTTPRDAICSSAIQSSVGAFAGDLFDGPSEGRGRGGGCKVASEEATSGSVMGRLGTWSSAGNLDLRRRRGSVGARRRSRRHRGCVTEHEWLAVSVLNHESSDGPSRRRHRQRPAFALRARLGAGGRPRRVSVQGTSAVRAGGELIASRRASLAHDCPCRFNSPMWFDRASLKELTGEPQEPVRLTKLVCPRLDVDRDDRGRVSPDAVRLGSARPRVPGAAAGPPLGRRRCRTVPATMGCACRGLSRASRRWRYRALVNARGAYFVGRS